MPFGLELLEAVLLLRELGTRGMNGLLVGVDTYRVGTCMGGVGDVIERFDGDWSTWPRWLGVGILEGAERGVMVLREDGPLLSAPDKGVDVYEPFHLGLSEGGLNCRRNGTGVNVGESALKGCPSGDEVVPKETLG